MVAKTFFYKFWALSSDWLVISSLYVRYLLTLKTQYIWNKSYSPSDILSGISIVVLAKIQSISDNFRFSLLSLNSTSHRFISSFFEILFQFFLRLLFPTHNYSHGLLQCHLNWSFLLSLPLHHSFIFFMHNVDSIICHSQILKWLSLTVVYLSSSSI